MKKSDNAVRAIRAATTETQVVAAIRDYLSSLESSEVALLPAEVTAFGLHLTEEVVQSALQLVHDQMLAVGDAPAPKDLPEPELAAWTSVARVILNLHETITRM